MIGRSRLALVAACVWALAAHAQPTVWRCGSSDARLYADMPCPGAQPVPTEPRPSAARIEAAREVARRERALADALAAQRQARDRSQRSAAPAALSSLQRQAQTARPADEAGEHGDGRSRKLARRSRQSAALAKDPRVTLRVKVPARPEALTSPPPARPGSPRQPG